MNKCLRNIYILLLCCAISLEAFCDTSRVDLSQLYINPELKISDSNQLSFILNFWSRNKYSPIPFTGHICVINLLDNDCISVPQSVGATCFSWRSTHNENLLTFITSTSPDLEEPEKLIQYSIAEKKVYRQGQLPAKFMVSSFNWAPDGSLLVGSGIYLNIENNYEYKGDILFLSRDGGKSFKLTDIRIKPRSLIWINNSMLFAQSDNDIIKIKITNKTEQIQKAYSFTDTIILKGAINKFPVYIKERKLFFDKNLLYTPKNSIRALKVNDEYMVLLDGTNIVVLNVNREITRCDVKSKDFLLLGFSDRKEVYLLNKYKNIEVFSLDKKKFNSTLFDVEEYSSKLFQAP